VSMATLLAAKSTIVAVWFLCFFAAERLVRAAAPPEGSVARLLRNGAMWLLILAASPFIVAPLTAWGVNHVVWTRPESLSSDMLGAAGLIVSLISLDLWTYWLHRAYHRVPAMWRLHEIHHRDEFLDTTSAVRFHLGEVILSALLRLIPIALLATPISTVIIFEALVLCAAIFHHSNLRIPPNFEGPLSRLIVTPSIHWVHHHALKADTDSNYATVLSLWDPMFRSKSPAKRSPEMKIGVEGVEDKGFFRLMLMPFRKADL